MRFYVRLGALIGLCEALAAVPWAWLMADWTAARIGTGLLWVAAFVAINAAVWGLAGLALRRRKWGLWMGTVGWLVLVLGTRAWSQDRFEWISLLSAPAALALVPVVERRPGLAGALAVPLAMAGLWGRAPVYTMPGLERLLFVLPAVAITCLGGLFPGRAALPAVGATLAAALAAAGLSPARPASAVEGKPNVLFVLVDTLRQDSVYPYDPAANTPSTRRLSEEGLRFPGAFTVIPKTTQSVAAYFTGQYPVNNGVRVLKDPIPEGAITLAERFRGAGYRTAAFAHNGWVMRGRGFEQGFQQFHSFYEIERAYGPLDLSGIVSALDWLSLRNIRSFDGNTDADVATDAALGWLKDQAAGGAPFFAYVHYFDPHWPYRPPGADAECIVNNIQGSRYSRGQMIFANPLPEKENRKAFALYDQEIAHNTDAVDRLFAWLEEAGIAEDTIVVFTADHGHHLGDHDYYYHHGEFLYEPGMKIPLFLRWRGRLDAGVIDKPVASIDVAPTLLRLAGLEVPAGMDGVDLIEGQRADTFLETDISYFRMNKRRYVPGNAGKVRGWRKGSWKLIYTPRKGPGEWELYDLAADPQELQNRMGDAAVDSAMVLEMIAGIGANIPEDERKELEELGNRFDRLPGGEAAPAPQEGASDAATEVQDPNELRMLQALGYVE